MLTNAWFKECVLKVIGLALVIGIGVIGTCPQAEAGTINPYKVLKDRIKEKYKVTPRNHRSLIKKGNHVRSNNGQIWPLKKYFYEKYWDFTNGQIYYKSMYNMRIVYWKDTVYGEEKQEAPPGPSQSDVYMMYNCEDLEEHIDETFSVTKTVGTVETHSDTLTIGIKGNYSTQVAVAGAKTSWDISASVDYSRRASTENSRMESIRETSTLEMVIPAKTLWKRQRVVEYTKSTIPYTASAVFDGEMRVKVQGLKYPNQTEYRKGPRRGEHKTYRREGKTQWVHISLFLSEDERTIEISGEVSGVASSLSYYWVNSRPIDTENNEEDRERCSGGLAMGSAATVETKKHNLYIQTLDSHNILEGGEKILFKEE